MGADVLILHAKTEETLIRKLSVELDIIGIVANADIVISSQIQRQLSEALHSHAMAVLLVTEGLLRDLEQTDTNVGKVSECVAVLGFSLKQEFREHAEHILPDVKPIAAKSPAGLARAILVELAEPSRSQRLTVQSTAESMWQSPLYIFKASHGLDQTDDFEILVDVTWSSKPTRPQMSPALTTALRKTFGHLGRSSLKILDFGAGKLRHTLPLLEKGHIVDAVDYRSLYAKPSPEIRKNLIRAQQYGDRFKQVIYPAEFAKQQVDYDLILLINVLNIMPEPLERYFVLHKCNENLSKGGHLLWFCQFGDALQLKATSELRITDGGCTSKRGRKTFYKDYNDRKLIIQMMSVMGFDQAPVKFDEDKYHAILFKRVRPPAIDVTRVIHTKRRVIGRRVFRGDIESENVVADVLDGTSFVGYGASLAVTLKQIKPGREEARKFEEVICPIIEYLFYEDFTKAGFDTQHEIGEGRQRIDIKAEWRDASELRTAIVQNMGLKSSFIPIECKNYSQEIGNKEYGQIVLRCDQRYRQVGMLFCRKVKDRRDVTRHCHDILTAHNYLVTVFDDDDIVSMLEFADQGDFETIRGRVRERIEEVRDQ
jgi:2-polyprenyl-3-methyl-5-hydroxy-6-metoxy-1,4-benzoquinol methylase